MNKSSLNSDLDIVIKNFEKKFETLQCRGYEEELQNAINELGGITLNTLKNFKKAILNNMD